MSSSLQLNGFSIKLTRMRVLYTILLYLSTPLILLRLLLRSRKNLSYRKHWRERFGHIPLINNKKTIWLHAVSLGESVAAAPLIQRLLNQYPDFTLVITNTTPTGRAQIIKQFGDDLRNFYTPYDLPHVVKRFITKIHPALVIIMETELWPNLLYYLNNAKVPIMIANARLSERSFKNYEKLRRLFIPLLSPIHVCVQSKADAKRFKALGVHEKNLFITGNIKFDNTLPDSLLEKAKTLREHWGKRPTLIAASTHEGEEIIVLMAFKKIQEKFPDALLILVPRHPERFDKMANLCLKHEFTVARRSKEELPNENTAIFLGDTMGELMLFYAISDVSFVGGSLLPIGGHNLIEPASLSLPIITGPNLQNFIAIRDLLMDANALIIANNVNELTKQVILLFENENQRHQFGANALGISEKNRGAIEKHMEYTATLVSLDQQSMADMF
jgi:3-deoxy-D-manno-octulosonic-acid transferase